MFSVHQIQERIKELKITQEELADKLGEKQQTISAWFTRGNIPRLKMPKLLNAINMDIKEAVKSESTGDVISVRIATIEAGAAHALDVDCIDEFTNDGSVQLLLNSSAYLDINGLIAIRVNGKSMLPTLMPDDMVVIDMNKNFYSGDDLYVFNYAGNLLVKRLQYNPSNNSFMVTSDNKLFDTYSINLSEDQSHFKIVGRVISTISR